MKKSLVSALILASALAAPVFAFAQSNSSPVTRAEVKAELVQLEKAGYKPTSDRNHYPDALLAAEARLLTTELFAVGFRWSDRPRHAVRGLWHPELEIGIEIGVRSRSSRDDAARRSRSDPMTAAAPSAPVGSTTSFSRSQR